MKKQLIAIIASVLTLFAAAQTGKPDVVLENLKGKVKSLNEIAYEATEKFGELEKGKKITRIYREYTTTGYEQHFIHENFDDEEKDKFVRTTRYENSRPVEIKEDDNGEVEMLRYKYNQQGFVESIDGLNGKGTLQKRQKNKYNADGLLTQADLYKADGSQDMRTINTYNSKKQQVKVEYYNKDGELTNLYTYAYDNRDNIIERSSQDYARNEKKPTVYKFVFNANGQKLEERNSISGLEKKEIYEYNVQGDMVRQLDEYGTEEKMTYTYDAQNNWVKCVTTKQSYGKTTFEIVERQIKYY